MQAAKRTLEIILINSAIVFLSDKVLAWLLQYFLLCPIARMPCIDAAYHLLSDSHAACVCVSGTTVSCAKMTEPIKIMCGGQTYVSPANNVRK